MGQNGYICLYIPNPSHPVLGARQIANLLVVHRREVHVHHPMRQQRAGADNVTSRVAAHIAQQVHKVRVVPGHRVDGRPVQRVHDVRARQPTNALRVIVPQIEEALGHAAKWQRIDQPTVDERIEIDAGLKGPVFGGAEQTVEEVGLSGAVGRLVGVRMLRLGLGIG